MGFNITQIINKFVPTKRVDDDLRENPLGTKVGQEVVSVSETFWARMAREGRQPKGVFANNVTLPNTGAFTSIAFNPTVDCAFYPKHLSVSSNVDAELIIQLNTNIPQVVAMYPIRVFVKAGTPIIIECDGEMVIDSNGTIVVGAINNGASAGVLYGAIFGYEVNINA
ncbi:hypothetical protein CN692_24180 [Bacillus sp. AFS002410]|uniref:hypothetical protein n=1 Tax=Bacillus sp. AFS002410 TaxID=2033481 RepID=UPI000BF23F88|nr:hypothetical protein [Bacillus sp. AFS002410]PEJ48208.1 hypothetical protein CN692_24180 [Bacillus sp. AFS002410]